MSARRRAPTLYALAAEGLERAGDDRAKAVTALTHRLLADETLRQALVEPRAAGWSRPLLPSARRGMSHTNLSAAEIALLELAAAGHRRRHSGQARHPRRGRLAVAAPRRSRRTADGLTSRPRKAASAPSPSSRITKPARPRRRSPGRRAGSPSILSAARAAAPTRMTARERTTPTPCSDAPTSRVSTRRACRSQARLRPPTWSAAGSIQRSSAPRSSSGWAGFPTTAARKARSCSPTPTRPEACWGCTSPSSRRPARNRRMNPPARRAGDRLTGAPKVVRCFASTSAQGRRWSSWKGLRTRLRSPSQARDRVVAVGAVGAYGRCPSAAHSRDHHDCA